MPKASAIAEVSEAPLKPALAAPKATPTAKPSGMLCRVIANTSRILRCQVVRKPSGWSSPICRCGKSLSTAHKKPPPIKNPPTAGSQIGPGRSADSSIDGASSRHTQRCSDTRGLFHNGQLRKRELRFMRRMRRALRKSGLSR